jgi:hypothetical protein
MKVLIWIVCFFCLAVVRLVAQYSGIILGGIPTALLFGLTWFIAQKLCKKWDQRKSIKKRVGKEDLPYPEESKSMTPPKDR